jgi:hypothetical protein
MLKTSLLLYHIEVKASKPKKKKKKQEQEEEAMQASDLSSLIQYQFDCYLLIIKFSFCHIINLCFNKGIIHMDDE